MPISSAAASGSQAFFPPSNAVDNNTNTYWSKFGLGSWIQLDLGQQKVVCSLDISWYKGNERLIHLLFLSQMMVIVLLIFTPQRAMVRQLQKLMIFKMLLLDS